MRVGVNSVGIGFLYWWFLFDILLVCLCFSCGVYRLLCLICCLLSGMLVWLICGEGLVCSCILVDLFVVVSFAG